VSRNFLSSFFAARNPHRQSVLVVAGSNGHLNNGHCWRVYQEQSANREALLPFCPYKCDSKEYRAAPESERNSQDLWMACQMGVRSVAGRGRSCLRDQGLLLMIRSVVGTQPVTNGCRDCLGMRRTTTALRLGILAGRSQQ
jgi:hypothetical protein